MENDAQEKEKELDQWKVCIHSRIWIRMYNIYGTIILRNLINSVEVPCSFHIASLQLNTKLLYNFRSICPFSTEEWFFTAHRLFRLTRFGDLTASIYTTRQRWRFHSCSAILAMSFGDSANVLWFRRCLQRFRRCLLTISWWSCVLPTEQIHRFSKLSCKMYHSQHVHKYTFHSAQLLFYVFLGLECSFHLHTDTWKCSSVNDVLLILQTLNRLTHKDGITCYGIRWYTLYATSLWYDVCIFVCVYVSAWW